MFRIIIFKFLFADGSHQLVQLANLLVYFNVSTNILEFSQP
jgi:hypothetical protein